MKNWATWIKKGYGDYHFAGISKDFDKYVVTGTDQERRPYGHFAVLKGVKSWVGTLDRAGMLYGLGLKYVTQRHGINAVGMTGPYRATYMHVSEENSGTHPEVLSSLPEREQERSGMPTNDMSTTAADAAALIDALYAPAGAARKPFDLIHVGRARLGAFTTAGLGGVALSLGLFWGAASPSSVLFSLLGVVLAAAGAGAGWVRPRPLGGPAGQIPLQDPGRRGRLVRRGHGGR